MNKKERSRASSARMYDKLFMTTVCCFLCGSLLLFCGQKMMGFDFPSWLTAEDSSYLSGGTIEPDVRTTLNLDGFISEELQRNLEIEVGNYVPCKASAMLGNAALQRGAIAASDTLFNWDCYPTYFGSERLYIPSVDALTYMPLKAQDDYKLGWHNFAEGVCSVAKRHPDVQFVVYVVNGYNYPALNPAYALTSGPSLPEDCLHEMKSSIENDTNVTVLTKEYDDLESYYADFFRSDHHWNIKGALYAMDQIIDTLGMESSSYGAPQRLEEQAFSGATARWGLDLVREDTIDITEKFDHLEISSDSGLLRGDDHSTYYGYFGMSKLCRFYDAYYDNLPLGEITGGRGDGTALLISNSYGAALQRPLADSCEMLVTSRELRSSVAIEESLSRRIDRYGADSVVFVAHPDAFAGFNGKCSKFFE